MWVAERTLPTEVVIRGSEIEMNQVLRLLESARELRGGTKRSETEEVLAHLKSLTKDIAPGAAMVFCHRDTRGWTQAELAKRVGVSQSYIAAIENSRKKISTNLANKLAEAFGIEDQEVFTDDFRDLGHRP